MKKKSLQKWGVATVAAALLVTTGCSTGSAESEVADDPAAKTLTVAWTATPTQLDPNVFTGLTWVYASDTYMATLLEYDTSVDPDKVIGVEDLKPSLAESWEANEDQTQFTFKLRKGVMSPYGNEMTADDVIYTFERMYQNPKGIGPGILFPSSNVDAANPVEKIDDYTIQYNLTAPSAFSLPVLAYPVLGILDSTEVKKHATEADPWASEWLATNSAGFGPYQLDSIKPGEELRLSANPNYFDEAPYFEELIIKAVPDGSARAQLLIAGEVDIISEPPIDQLKNIADSENARVSQMADSNRHNLSISTKSEILANPTVRQALSHAINREEIADSIYQGYAKPAYTPVSSVLLSDQPEVGKYDPKLAKKLLAEAGYADGFDMVISFSTERPGPYAENLARLIQSNFAEIGVNASLEPVPSPADFEAGVAEKRYESFLYSDRPSQPDPGFSLFLYSYSKSALNKTGYANAELDALILEALKLPTGAERTAVLEDAVAILAEDQPILNLVEVPDLAGVGKDIEGFRALPTGGTMFQELSRK